MVFDLVVNKNKNPRTVLQFKVRLTHRFPAVRIAKSSTIKPTIGFKETADCILYCIQYNDLLLVVFSLVCGWLLYPNHNEKSVA